MNEMVYRRIVKSEPIPPRMFAIPAGLLISMGTTIFCWSVVVLKADPFVSLLSAILAPSIFLLSIQRRA